MWLQVTLFKTRATPWWMPKAPFDVRHQLSPGPVSPRWVSPGPPGPVLSLGEAGGCKTPRFWLLPRFEPWTHHLQSSSTWQTRRLERVLALARTRNLPSSIQTLDDSEGRGFYSRQHWLTKPITPPVRKRNSLQLLVWHRGFSLKSKTDFFVSFFLSGQFSPQLL